MSRTRILTLVILAAGALTGCVPITNTDDAIDRGSLWVQSAAEYEALSLQAYSAAGNDLSGFIYDTSWSALPTQTNAADLPAAIITDVDETVVSNIEFQIAFEHPFTNKKMNDWNNSHVAKPVPGAAEFIRVAREAGIEVFFVTNRPCESQPGKDDPCPQKKVTVQDLIEAGVPADAEHVLLAGERPGWGKEKLSRRHYIAQTHRVIMLFGDDLGDFLVCSRETPVKPCSDAATIATRHAATRKFGRYWGNGWYVLPNPMHGSWTKFN